MSYGLSVRDTWERIMKAARLVLAGEPGKSSEYITGWLHGGRTDKEKFFRAWYYGATGPMIVSVAIRNAINGLVNRPPAAEIPEWLAVGLGPLSGDDGTDLAKVSMIQMASALVNDDMNAAADVLTAHYEMHGDGGIIKVGDAAMLLIVRISRGEVGLGIEIHRVNEPDWNHPHD